MATIKDEVFAVYMASGGSQPAVDQSAQNTNLMVNYLPYDMGERELCGLFNEFGRIKHVKIIRDLETGCSHGYGFVNFELASHAKLALAALNGCQVRDKRLKVALARPSSADIKNAKIYVANLPVSFDEQQLLILFERYGNVLDINILRDKFTGQPRGAAFVRFEVRSSADLAVSIMNGYKVQAGQKPLQVTLAMRPRDWIDSRPMHLDSQPKDMPSPPKRPAKFAVKRLMLDSETEVQFKRAADFPLESNSSDSQPPQIAINKPFGRTAKSDFKLTSIAKNMGKIKKPTAGKKRSLDRDQK